MNENYDINKNCIDEMKWRIHKFITLWFIKLKPNFMKHEKHENQKPKFYENLKFGQNLDPESGRKWEGSGISYPPYYT